MRKSLFSKIFLMQIAVALTVILLIVPSAFFLMGEYFVNSQKEDILQDAARVASLSESLASHARTDSESWAFYKIGIELASSKSSVIIVNGDGDVVAYSQQLSGVDIDRIDKSFIEPVENGESAVFLRGRDKIFSEQTIVAMVPIMQKNVYSNKKNVIGAAIALRTTPQIRNIQYGIMKIVLIAQLFAWMLAFVVSYILARQIANPIKKMRIAAKSIASGNFKERIPITSNDEIGQLAESFNHMTQSLSELETMRSSFVSDVSHELRTPMTIISGFVEGIVDGTIHESEHRKYLDIVLSETKRLSRLVTELLEASRLEQGKIVLNKQNIDMNRLVTEAIVTYEQPLTQKGIDVELSLEADECIAFADKDSIKRVLINLIDNAIKFTPPGGKIEIKTEYRDKKVATTVENTGEGISQDDLRHIWERFYKTDKSRGMDKKGVGLGLHIVKTIIANHGGEIYAESVEGKFARFVFLLDEGKKNDIINENGRGDQNEK